MALLLNVSNPVSREWMVVVRGLDEPITTTQSFRLLQGSVQNTEHYRVRVRVLELGLGFYMLGFQRLGLRLVSDHNVRIRVRVRVRVRGNVRIRVRLGLELE